MSDTIKVEPGFVAEFGRNSIVWSGQSGGPNRTRKVNLDSLLAHVELYDLKFCEAVNVIESGQVIGHARKVIGLDQYVIYIH